MLSRYETISFSRKVLFYELSDSVGVPDHLCIPVKNAECT